MYRLVLTLLENLNWHVLLLLAMLVCPQIVHDLNLSLK